MYVIWARNCWVDSERRITASPLTNLLYPKEAISPDIFSSFMVGLRWDSRISL